MEKYFPPDSFVFLSDDGKQEHHVVVVYGLSQQHIEYLFDVFVRSGCSRPPKALSLC